ncbi:hypothetical protein EDC63_10294 [Sulfurirhabdus autotrophica]|uniref:Uncharacterized protein n=1 Tax=Sulfurirhabdus autotrophica TaxID=1706046 RepID=A0A4R3YC51_9PROT|nr:hypothetical protein EDC63_10294 [Sulfurirhabdus autotrophica]
MGGAGVSLHCLDWGLYQPAQLVGILGDLEVKFCDFVKHGDINKKRNRLGFAIIQRPARRHVFDNILAEIV